MVLSQIGWAPFFCERLFKCNIDLASAVAGVYATKLTILDSAEKTVYESPVLRDPVHVYDCPTKLFESFSISEISFLIDSAEMGLENKNPCPSEWRGGRRESSAFSAPLRFKLSSRIRI